MSESTVRPVTFLVPLAGQTRMDSMTEHQALKECMEAFRAMRSASDARKFMKYLGIAHEPYAGDGRLLLADEMFRRLVIYLASPASSSGP